MLRNDLNAFPDYQPGKDYPDALKLSSNEVAFEPSKDIIAAVAEAGQITPVLRPPLHAAVDAVVEVLREPVRDGAFEAGAGSAGGGQAARQLLDARQGLRRPLTEADVQAAPGMQARYTRTAQNEIHRQFHRLPNPDLVMYVFPHLAGTDPVPVPGYSTVFPLYQRVQYAMPGERVEDY